MSVLDASSIVERCLTPTKYCWPITGVTELQEASRNLRSRVNTEHAEIEPECAGIQSTVDQQLAITEFHQYAALTPVDETGRSVLFLHVLAPLARERSRSLALLDDAANGKPLLITVLLPDLGFNLSEVEAAYGFSIYEELEANFGAEAPELMILYDRNLYINSSALFHILCQQHPALLMSLAYSLKFRHEQSIKVREILRGLDEELLRTMEINSEEIMHRRRVEVLINTERVIGDIICEEEQDDTWYVRLRLYEALGSLITDETAALERQYLRVTASYDIGDVTPPMDLMEVCGAEDTAGLQRLTQGTKRVRHRLFMIRQTIPR